MYVSLSPSEPQFPGHLRAAGAVSARFAVGHRGTRIADLYESGGFRLKFPFKDTETAEAILVNTGGGMTGGDSLDVSIIAEAESQALVTTQSAEKVYRSSGDTARLSTKIELESGANFAWLPQETILFSGARVARELHVSLPEKAIFLGAESVVFGRSASGEILGQGYFSDLWRIRRADKLIFAENTRLDGDLAPLLARDAIANGARAFGTLIMVAPDAEERLETLREALPEIASTCALSAWNGMLVARLLSKDAQVLRQALSKLVTRLRGAPMPRVWQC